MSSQIRQEILNQSIYGVRQVMQRWKQRFTLSNPNFSKRFLARNQSILVHLRSSKYPAELWVAQFVHKHCGKAQFADPIGMAHRNLSHGQNEAVFARIIKLAENPKRIVPTLVRLQRIDQFYRIRLDELYVSSLGFFVSGATLVDREFATSQLLLSQSRESSKSHLRNEMVKRATEVVNHIPRRRERIKGKMIDKDLTWIGLLGLNLYLSAGEVTVKLPKTGFHITEILFGPLNLRPNQSEPLGRSPD